MSGGKEAVSRVAGKGILDTGGRDGEGGREGGKEGREKTVKK